MDRIVTHRLPLERFQDGIDLVAAGDRSIKVTLEPQMDGGGITRLESIDNSWQKKSSLGVPSNLHPMLSLSRSLSLSKGRRSGVNEY